MILYFYPLVNICKLLAGLKINDQWFQRDSSHICQRPKSWQAPLSLAEEKHLFRGLCICLSQVSESRQTNRGIWPWRCFDGPHCVLTLSQPTLISQNLSLLNESGLGTVTWAHITHTITHTYNICAEKHTSDTHERTVRQQASGHRHVKAPPPFLHRSTRTERDTIRLQVMHPAVCGCFCLFKYTYFVSLWPFWVPL